MRQIYETPEDLAKELTIMETVAKKWKCSFKKLPLSYKVDFVIFNKNRVRGLVEIRRRNVTYGRYPDGIFMSLGKFTTGTHYKRIMQVPFIFVVQFTDGLFYAELEDLYNVVWGGRGQLRDSADVEPLMLIPPSSFTEIVVDYE